jgi:hypothetical protein
LRIVGERQGISKHGNDTPLRNSSTPS